MNTLSLDLQTSYLRITKLLGKGNARVVGHDFLDWLQSATLPGKLKSLHLKLRTLPNPDKVGTLDGYIAFTTYDHMTFDVDGILKMGDKPVTATVACGRGKDGFLSLWFVGFNNSCQWKGNLIETDIADMIASRQIRLCPPLRYANGKEVGES